MRCEMLVVAIVREPTVEFLTVSLSLDGLESAVLTSSCIVISWLPLTSEDSTVTSSDWITLVYESPIPIWPDDCWFRVTAILLLNTPPDFSWSGNMSCELDEARNC